MIRRRQWNRLGNRILVEISSLDQISFLQAGGKNNRRGAIKKGSFSDEDTRDFVN